MLMPAKPRVDVQHTYALLLQEAGTKAPQVPHSMQTAPVGRGMIEAWLRTWRQQGCLRLLSSMHDIQRQAGETIPTWVPLSGVQTPPMLLNQRLEHQR